MLRASAVVIAVLIGAAGGIAQEAAWKKVPLASDPSAFALSPDGGSIVVAHEQAGELAVWDVKSNKQLRSVKTPSPRFVLCRGQWIFAASYDARTVTQLALSDLSVKRQFKLEAGPWYLSAAVGEFFHGKVFVTCSSPLKTYCLDTTTGQSQLIAKNPAGWLRVGETGAVASHAAGWGSIEDVLSGKDPISFGVSVGPDSRALSVDSTWRGVPDAILPVAWESPNGQWQARLEYSNAPCGQAQRIAAGDRPPGNVPDPRQPDGSYRWSKTQVVSLGDKSYVYCLDQGRPGTEGKSPTPPLLLRAVLKAPALPDIPRYSRLDGPRWCDAIALSEDSRLLLVVHSADDCVSIRDALSGKLLKTVACESPGAIMCRDGRAFVANTRSGAITVLSLEQGEAVDELKAPVAGKRVVHMTAGMGDGFGDRLLAHVEGDLWHSIDVKNDKAQPCTSSEQAPGKWYVGLDGKAPKCSENYDGYLMPLNKRGFWVTPNSLLAGKDPKPVKDAQQGQLVVAVSNRPMIAVLNKGTVALHGVDMNMTLLGEVVVDMPSTFRRQVLGKTDFRKWSSVPNPPLAVADDGRIAIYLNDTLERTIYRLEVPFTEGALPTPAGTALSNTQWTFVPLSASASRFDVTPDHTKLVIAHESADLISVYDISAGAVTRQVKFRSPSWVLCRGDKVYVANSKDATIGVFNLSDWKLTDEILTGLKHLRVLSAAVEGFSGQILALGPQEGSLVNVKEDTYRKVSAVSTSERLDAAGRRVVIANQPRLMSLEDFLAGKPLAADDSHPPVEQVPGTSLWIAGTRAYVGDRELKTLALAMPATRELALAASTSGSNLYKINWNAVHRFSASVGWGYTGSLNVQAPPSGRLACQAVAVGKENDEKIFLVADGKLYGLSAKMKSQDQLDPAFQAGDGKMPAKAIKGKALSVELKGRPAEAFELVKGPQGATLTSDGTLSWTPANTGTQEFKIRIQSGQDVRFDRYRVEVVELLDQEQGADLPFLLAGSCQLGRRLNGRSTYALNGRDLLILDADGRRLISRHDLGAAYLQIHERPECWVALDEKAVVLLDKRTLKPASTIKLDWPGVDMTVNSRTRLSYVAVRDAQASNQLEAQKVVQVDEASGKVRLLERLCGQTVAVDPSGRFLYTGTNAIYQRGLVVDLYWGDIYPSYGSVDVLACYDISRGQPEFVSVNFQPGQNLRKLKVAPDGSAVAVMAAIYEGSSRIASFDAEVVSKRVGVYALPRGAAADLDFHPSLDLVALCKEGDVRLFDRTGKNDLTGKLRLDGLKLSNVSSLIFSASGRRLIVEASNDRQPRRLHSIELSLTSDELAAIARGPRQAATSRPVDKDVTPAPQAPVKLAVADLQALGRAGAPGTLTAKEINSRYEDAVVVVKSAIGGGTGFVIGSEGYVLTCAHVLSRLDLPVVAYRQTTAGKTEMRKAQARIVFIDRKSDLALLKIAPSRKLPVVSLGGAAKVSAGEPVCIIGHPGLGEEMLEYTLTNGIVSNPRQTIDKQEYVQTNAAINPGCSGAPVFDSHGSVIGLVLLKGKIEAAGFAVPSDCLRAFLAEAIKAVAAEKQKAVNSDGK